MKHVDERDGHWIWTGKRKVREKGKGGGVFFLKGKETSAARWSFIYRNGEIEDNELVLSRCGVSACVNPEHLFSSVDHFLIRNLEEYESWASRTKVAPRTRAVSRTRVVMQTLEDENLLKRCCRCRREFPRTLEFFSPSSKRGKKILATQCRECNRISMQEYRLKYPERVKASKKRYMEENRLTVSLKNKEWREAIKFRVLSHYSKGTPKCEECGETDLRFLTIDHINGGGKKEAREEGHNHYATIVRKGFPSGYQVLCFNHNCGKRRTLQFKKKDHAKTIETVQRLGGVCVCCGETDLRFLTIDHIVPALREKRNHPKEIRESGYDKMKYQVLCFNCNMGKSAFGNHELCPHQMKD